MKPDSLGQFSRGSEGGMQPSSMSDEEDEIPANGFVTLAARVRKLTNEPVISSCSGQVPPSAEGLVAQFLNSVAGYKMSVEVVDGRVDV